MKKSILFLLLLVCCKEEKEPPPEDRKFMIQFIDNHVRTGNVLRYNMYYRDTVKVPGGFGEESFLNKLKNGKVEQYGRFGILKGEPPVYRISLSSKEIKKLSERSNFENMDYWRKTLFTDSSQLKLKNRIIKIVPAERGWIFTKPTFIRNNKYCFFGYSNSNRGGYYVYKKDSTGQWKQFIEVNGWIID